MQFTEKEKSRGISPAFCNLKDKDARDGGKNDEGDGRKLLLFEAVEAMHGGKQKNRDGNGTRINGYMGKGAEAVFQNHVNAGGQLIGADPP